MNDLDKAANDLEQALWLKCALITTVSGVNDLIRFHLQKYRDSEVKKLNIPAVSNSVCEHDWHRTGDPDRQSCRCTKCGEYDG